MLRNSTIAVMALAAASSSTGQTVGSHVAGAPGAIWADANNDGYVDGYVTNGQYYPGRPAGTLVNSHSSAPINSAQWGVLAEMAGHKFVQSIDGNWTGADFQWVVPQQKLVSRSWYDGTITECTLQPDPALGGIAERCSTAPELLRLYRPQADGTLKINFVVDGRPRGDAIHLKRAGKPGWFKVFWFTYIPVSEAPADAAAAKNAILALDAPQETPSAMVRKDPRPPPPPEEEEEAPALPPM